MKAGIITLGCPRNSVDSDKFMYRLKNRGVRVTTPEKADVLIINTCGFIETAKKESIDVIQHALSLKKKGKISKVIAAGCLISRYIKHLPEYLKGVDAFLGTIEDISPERIIPNPKHSAYIKIAEGCSNACSYCAIPLIRGKLKSAPVKNILDEVEFLNRNKVKEINITAQDITSWGKDRYRNRNLTYLLKQIVKKAKNIRWIRLLYTHPKYVSKELIKLMAKEPKICKYIDMPIQHINSRILKLMGRKISRREIEDKIKILREYIPGIAIRTTLITGFPTERKEEFEELLDFVKEYKFRNLGAFIYSREEETRAYSLRQVPEKVKKQRFHKLMTVQQEVSSELNKKLVGKDFDVIIDRRENNYSFGRAYFQAYDIDGEIIILSKLRTGSFYKIRITDAYEYDLAGKLP